MAAGTEAFPLPRQPSGLAIRLHREHAAALVAHDFDGAGAANIVTAAGSANATFKVNAD